MPVEIKEIVVKAAIDNRSQGSGTNAISPDQLKKTLEEFKEKIILECKNELMDQMERNNER